MKDTCGISFLTWTRKLSMTEGYECTTDQHSVLLIDKLKANLFEKTFLQLGPVIDHIVEMKRLGPSAVLDLPSFFFGQGNSPVLVKKYPMCSLAEKGHGDFAALEI